MDRSELKSFRQWMRSGRAVRAGQKAAFFAVSPDGADRLALFSIEQTESYDDDPREDWTTIVPASEAPAKPRRKPPEDPRPKVYIDYEPETQKVKVWCGPNKEAIAILRKSKYTYHAGIHRWCATRDDVTPVAAGFERRNTFNVILTVDGAEDPAV